MSKRILVIDDEGDVLDLIAMHLRAEGYDVSLADSGPVGLERVKQNRPDAIILDLMLPNMDGMEVCKQLKADSSTRPIPIIMLTARVQATDRVTGLEIGADDYVTKPFSPRELTLRVKSVLRKGTPQYDQPERLQIGILILDRARHSAIVDGVTVQLTVTEFKLLAVLMERRGRVQNRERLLNDVWGYENIIDTRTVDTHVRRLREKIGRASAYIKTVRGVGYRMDPPGGE